MDLVTWEIWGNGFESLTIVRIGKKNLPRKIAKYCFFSNTVSLNGTQFFYLPKWRKGAYFLPLDSFLCLEGLLFLSPCWNLSWFFKLMLQTFLLIGNVTGLKWVCSLLSYRPTTQVELPHKVILICTNKETMGNNFQSHDCLTGVSRLLSSGLEMNIEKALCDLSVQASPHMFLLLLQQFVNI